MNRLALVLFLLWSSFVFAVGGIPDRYMSDPAVDLTRNGKLLLPEEVHQLRESSKGHFDIATLNPEEDTDLWKNILVKELPADNVPINDMDIVRYNSPVLSQTGIFRFNVLNGPDKKLYTMMISKTVHNVLLAKSLLRKIGYQIPDIKYLPRVIVEFKDESQKKAFTSYLENVAFAGSAKNWVVDELEGNKLLLQDLIVMDSNHLVYNLAVGATSDMIQGRRLLAALAVPLSIVNVPESVNMFRWSAGEKSDHEIKLFHDSLDQFQCTWDDARWIARRIERLSREDWNEIIESSNIPKPVQMVLAEKIISRRNSIMKLFKIDATRMKVDADVSHGVELVKGKLTQQKWPGYGSRFAFGDPDSPLADSEIKSYVKSRAISNALDFGISQINQLEAFGTNIKEANEKEFQKKIQKLIEKSNQQGYLEEMSYDSWQIPTIRGQLIFSRNIITGTYMGTDNLVQLADTIGVSVDVGLFYGTMGLPDYTSLYGTANAVLVRTYAHLRPVTSIQKALKYPFKNIFVPLVKRDYGLKLHTAITAAGDSTISEEERADKIEESLKPFKEAMEIGETILITDTVGAMIGGKLGLDYEKMISASMGLSAKYKVLSRFHVHRRTEHDFQIYRDFAHAGSFDVAFKLDGLIPVLELNYKKAKGQARVKFYNLNLNPKNPDVVKNASLLREAIVSSSTGRIEEENGKPLVIRHNYRESNPGMNLFFWQWRWQNSSSEISVTNPKGDQKFYRRTYHGNSKGRNYQAYVDAMITHWVSLLFEKNAGLSESGDNAGFTYQGKAKNRFLTLDEEVDKTGRQIEPFIKLSRVYNGWSINRDNAQEILNEIRQRYRHDFFNAPVLNDTRRIFLYMISLNIFFYQAGIEHLLSLDADQIKRIFRENVVHSNLMINSANVEDADTGVFKFLKFLVKFRKYQSESNYKKANKFLLKAFSQAEYRVNLKGLVQLVGSEDNIYISSRIEGFREGDEDGDKPLKSDTIGEFGSRNVLGPIVETQRSYNMLEGEFFIYWMMQRLI